MFTPGQKVLCINDRPIGQGSLRPTGIKNGEVYTVVNEGVMVGIEVVFIEEYRNEPVDNDGKYIDGWESVIRMFGPIDLGYRPSENGSKIRGFISN